MFNPFNGKFKLAFFSFTFYNAIGTIRHLEEQWDKQVVQVGWKSCKPT
jgi:hypothetical protein